MEVVDRLAGVRIDPQRLEFELACRGLRARELAERSGVSEVTLSRARHGHAVAPATLGQLVRALAAIPPVAGADLLLAAPETKRTAGGAQSPAVSEERNAAATSITG